jgi:hypothetical protein
MKQLQWFSDREFSVDGVRFLCAFDDYSLKTSDERFVILKKQEDFANYTTVFSEVQPRNVLEFGIFQGGSSALFSLWFEVEKFVGVSAAPLDAVIDDASHLYGVTRRTFEIAFPHLRPGGVYVIEDWGWAHWPDSRFFVGETALSMLIMELTMLCASRSDLVSQIRIFPSFAFIQKAPNAPDIRDFALDSLYSKRGIELVGARDADLGGVAGLPGKRVADSAAKKLRRLRNRTRRK